MTRSEASRVRQSFVTGKPDGQSVTVTTLVLTITVTILALEYINIDSLGSYLLGWTAMLFLAILCLCMLSSPSSVHVFDDKVELCSVLKITYIRTSDISSVNPVDALRRYRLLELGGLYGLFGYYGMFYDISLGCRVRLFSKRRKDLVMIVDKSGHHYCIATDNNKLFIDTLNEVINKG